MHKLLTFLSFLLVLHHIASAQTNNYYGTTGPIDGASWNTNPAGPYTQAFNATGGGIMNFNNTAGSNKLAADMAVAGMNFNANFTLGSVTAAKFLAYSGAVPINVASGIVADFKVQPFGSGTSASFTKEGDGMFVTAGGTYTGAFTLNAGTLTSRGANAMGNGSLVINAGTIAGTATWSYASKFPNGITINGDFTLGSSTSPAVGNSNITFSNNTSLGSSATRTITMDGTGTYTFSGPISGTNAGITVNSSGGGTLLLTGQNTYTGTTTVNAGTLQLNRSGGGTLPNTNIVVVNGGTLLISSNQTLHTLTLNGGTVNIASGVTLTISNKLEYGASGGTITGSGTMSVPTTATVSNSYADGVTTAFIAKCGCGSSHTYEFTGTLAQVTGTGLPSSVAGLVINNSSNVALSSTLTATNLTLTSGKLLLGANDLTVTTISGANSSNYIVTDGIGGLTQNVSTSEKEFPVGSGTDSYDPVTITPSAASPFKVSVNKTNSASDFPGSIVDYSKVAKRVWSITPTGSPGSSILKLKNGGGGIFPSSPKMGHFSSITSLWEELSASFSDNTWTATTTSFSPFGGGEVGGFVALLPIELLSFQAEKQDNAVMLTWETASEINNDYMAIERSTNGNDFHEIGRVNGTGTTTDRHEYHLMDEHPALGNNYYRLVQVDLNGKKEYHRVIAVSFDSAAGGMTVLPTAVKEKMEVYFAKTTVADGILEIWSVAGQHILTERVLSNTQNITINTDTLLPGLYFVRSNFGNVVNVQNFVKL